MGKVLNIGDKCILVHRDYAGRGKPGGYLIPARLRTYRNIKGKVEPIFYPVGSPKAEYTLSNYVIFLDVQKAIDSIIS